MISQTNYTVNIQLLQEACAALPEQGMKTTINKPTGNFFYDSWVLKDEYRGTVWETLYESLPMSKGEARIIILDPGLCYQSHADIDDRYHLNILGDNCYLIDLVRETMHPLSRDGVWYDMDAGFLHTATNFGRCARIQLVIRKLLKKNNLLHDPVSVKLESTLDNKDYARYLFDNSVSPWLNQANKSGIINNFSYTREQVTFDIEADKLNSLAHILPEEICLTHE
jgi:hypothetical protein